MTARTTGGAAFPRPHSWDESPVSGIHEGDRPAPHAEQAGMTLRDYFAAAAMQGAIASTYGQGRDVAEYAESAYAIADAMLAERVK